MHALKNIIEGMRNRTMDNYAIAGLSSSLLGGAGFGCIRLFEKEQHQHSAIAPHTHRFDFTCLVLHGHIDNIIWKKSHEDDGDLHQSSLLTYSGVVGKYNKTEKDRYWYTTEKTRHGVGDCCSMTSDEIHSIIFSKGAKVIFFEGPSKSDTSIMLEPVIGGKVIPTGEVKDWMFTQRA